MDKNKELISFVIPVYNADKYIEQCVNSIVSQTYKYIEVILVDNGSTDNSGAVCVKLSGEDERIKLITLEKNILASGARNTGVAAATGEWLIFMDSDDFWDDQNGLENLLKDLSQVKYDIDFLIFNYKRYFQKDNKYNDRPDFSKTLISTIEKQKKIELLLKNSFIPISSWGKIIKLGFLKDKNINFIEGSNAEDIPWFILLLEKCNNFALSNLKFHVYRKQVPGAGTYSFNPKTFNDLLKILESESLRLKEDFNNPLQYQILSFLAYQYSILMSSAINIKGNDWKFYKKRLLELKWLLKFDSVDKVKKVNKLVRFAPYVIVCKILNVYAKKVVNRL